MTDGTCSVPGCARTKLMARGWCGPHYKRWYRYGDPLATVNRRAPSGATADERLRYVGWVAVQRRDALTPCWEWKGLTDRAGYGRLWDGTRVAAAHRLAYEAWVGSVPAGQHVCHRCDNPLCVRPEHLFTGDDVVNSADMVAKKRSANGERKPQHRLTDADVAAIRAAYTGRRGEQAMLARAYGVAPSLISMIVRNRARTEATHWEAVHDDRRLARVRRP